MSPGVPPEEVGALQGLPHVAAGTHFTHFTRTKVQILTPEERQPTQYVEGVEVMPHLVRATAGEELHVLVLLAS